MAAGARWRDGTAQPVPSMQTVSSSRRHVAFVEAGGGRAVVAAHKCGLGGDDFGRSSVAPAVSPENAVVGASAAAIVGASDSVAARADACADAAAQALPLP